MPYGWQGEKTRLVPLDKARHHENSLAWFNDPELTAWLIGDWPLSRVADEEFFDRMARETESALSLAVETHDGEHIGFASIDRIDWRSRVASTGTLIGRRDLWGKGYGLDACVTRARLAFDGLGLRLLLNEIMVGNEASTRMHRKVGGQEVGRIPERYWKRGAYRDLLILALRREVFHELWGAPPTASAVHS
ncbi:MAG TPA: GNAT family N-acetyltransferase [Thermoanaerobaculia bacterium]|jgi:RimJ/RimL family protein N-acetyltransferase